MTTPTRVEHIGDATLYLGDCLELMPHAIPAIGACACITDPPYGINTKSDGLGKLNPWADLCNSAYWYAEWFRVARSRLSTRGCMWTCLNWRSMVTFQKAAHDARWPIESMLVWDKRILGTGGPRGLRPSYEMVALFANEDFYVDDRSVPDVQAFPWVSIKPNGHPAEKPVALMDFLVRHGSRVGDLVFDPFMGSGTTGEAALSAGRRFVGIECDPVWFDLACQRIENSQRQQALFSAAS
jgi:DNA modification methylase